MYHHQPIKRSKDSRGPTLGVRGSAVSGKREKNLWLLKREDFICHFFFLLKELPLYSDAKPNGINQKKKPGYPPKCGSLRLFAESIS